MDIQDEFVTTERYLQNLSTRLGIPQAQLYENNLSLLWENGMFLLLNEENISRRYMNSYLSDEKIEISQSIEISTMDLLIEFARIDMGIAWVIGNFAEKEIDKTAFGKSDCKKKNRLCQKDAGGLSDCRPEVLFHALRRF